MDKKTYEQAKDLQDQIEQLKAEKAEIETYNKERICDDEYNALRKIAVKNTNVLMYMIEEQFGRL